MRPADYLALILAGALAIALPGGATGAAGGLNTNASPYPGRPVPGRPIPTRPSPYNSVPTVSRPAIAPLKGNVDQGGTSTQPSSNRAYGGTSRTPKECEGLARRAMDSDDEKMWKRYRDCVDMRAD